MENPAVYKETYFLLSIEYFSCSPMRGKAFHSLKGGIFTFPCWKVFCSLEGGIFTFPCWKVPVPGMRPFTFYMPESPFLKQDAPGPRHFWHGQREEQAITRTSCPNIM
jgi:hypothetical protein